MKKAITLLTVVFAGATAITSAAPMNHGIWNKHEMNEQHEEMKSQVESAVINNDYVAYKALMKNKKDLMKWGDDTKKKRMVDKNAVYDWYLASDHEERMKKHFDMQVAYYQENGQLMQNRWIPSHKRSGKYFGHHEKWIVKAALNNVSEKKLSQVIDRIDTLSQKLDPTDDEQILDMLLWIREVLAAKLSI